MAYTFDQIFAADPANPSNVAANAAVLIYAPGDATKTPLVITDPSGGAIDNPVIVNANGFGTAFMHETLDRVAWDGGGFSGFFTSYEGMKNEAVDARTAAQEAAATAGADAAAVATAAIGDATAEAEAAADSAATAATNAAASATAAANSAALVGAPADSAIAAAINNGASSTRGALNATYASKPDNGGKPVGKGELVLNVKDYGAKGDGTTDDTAAIQSAINAATAGATIFFPWTGAGAFYKITDTLTVTTANVRLLGVPRDGYAMSIRCAVASKTMIAVKAAGFVLQDIGLMGDVSAVNGVGATVTGLELFGTTDADLDALVKGCTFQWLAKGVRTHGRNSTVQDSLFSNCLNGVTIDGPDATYNTGSNAAQNRGNLIRGNRFHNIGANANDSAFEVTSAAKVLHAVIDGNHFDSNGGGRHVKVTGTSTNTHSAMTFANNKHTEAQADAYNLTYVQNSSIVGAHISALTGTSLYGNGVVLANCDTIKISNLFGLQLGNSGVVATSSNRIHVEDTRFRSIGLNPGTTGHGLDFNSSNSQCRFDRVTVETTDGYGFNGDPGDSSMTDCEFRSCTLGNVNSTTLRNRAANGRNNYIEAAGGRKQDSASKPFDLADGVATPIATVTSANNFSSFEVEVKVIGRNSAGNLYARYVRYVRPENGSPVYVTPVADVAQGTITLAFAASGTTGVTVSATVTGSTAFVTAHVTALAGGGAATGNARGVTVAMS